jgi:hypothetical protein
MVPCWDISIWGDRICLYQQWRMNKELSLYTSLTILYLHPHCGFSTWKENMFHNKNVSRHIQCTSGATYTHPTKKHATFPSNEVNFLFGDSKSQVHGYVDIKINFSLKWSNLKFFTYLYSVCLEKHTTETHHEKGMQTVFVPLPGYRRYNHFR